MAKKKYLVLVAASIAGVSYACGDVINIEKTVGDDYVKAGQLDGAPAATSNAIANGAEVIEHVSSEDTAAAEAAAAAKAAAIADLEARLAAAADADKPALQAELDKLKAE